MCKKLQVVFFSAIFFLINNFAFSETHLPKNQSTIDVGKVLKLQNQKYLMTPPKKTKSIFISTINKINDECCEDDYPKKSRLEELYISTLFKLRILLLYKACNFFYQPQQI